MWAISSGISVCICSHADLPEETALPEPGLDQLGPGHQIIPRSSPDLAIDDQPVLNGKMTDDPVGIRQDRVVTGQRCQDVGFDPDIGDSYRKTPPRTAATAIIRDQRKW